MTVGRAAVAKVTRVVFMCLLLGISACFDSVLDVDTAAGEYALKSIDGAALPVLLTGTSGGEVEVLSGSIDLDPDGTAASVLTTSNGTDSKAGTWTRTNQSVFMIWSDGSFEAGTQAGDSLSIDLPEAVYLYRR